MKAVPVKIKDDWLLLGGKKTSEKSINWTIETRKALAYYSSSRDEYKFFGDLSKSAIC